MRRQALVGVVTFVTGLGVASIGRAQNAVECVKPWAIPDRWIENQTPGWDRSDTFSRYETQGQSAGQLVPSADAYVPPTEFDPGSGFRLFDSFGVADYGLQLTVKASDNAQSPAGGWFNVVDLGGAGGGGAAYRAAIAGCLSTPVAIGQVLPIVNGNLNGPTVQGVLDLIGQDPNAFWDQTAGGGNGAVAGSDSATISPRVVPVIVYDPDLFQASLVAGTPQVTVVNILGMFIEGLESKAVIGRFVSIPAPQ